MLTHHMTLHMIVHVIALHLKFQSVPQYVLDCHTTTQTQSGPKLGLLT